MEYICETERWKDKRGDRYDEPAIRWNEKIIRCRDCFYWCDEDFCINPQWKQSLYEAPCTDPDSFCSFAATPDDIEREIERGA